MLEGVKWGEFRIGDLFEIGTGSLLSGNELNKGSIPRISVRSDNNGILGYFDTEKIDNSRHFENFISVNFFGSDGGIFYHPYKASVEMKVHTLKIPNIEFNARTGKFIASSLSISLNGFNYGSQLSSSKLKNLNFKIKLPICENGEINFSFMEKFIAELEATHLAELEAYLQVTGLKDYKLTNEEISALEDFENDSIKWCEFRLGDLFKIEKTKSFNSDSLVDGFEYDYVTRTSINQGILQTTGFINDNNINSEGTWSLGLLQMDFFYREKKWYAGQFVRKVIPKFELNEYTKLYFSSVLNSLKPYLLTLAVRFVDEEFRKIKVNLPVFKNNIPNYDFMQTFIRAIEKLVIKDIVLFAERKIKATKSVINK
ncbi:restriction endonuclease subunit S [Campylobacter pinnipediorum]|uniref:restriction endonuclease subunit S n=1 Tax=Campylobacter pinnipediorum TaxID=1965231 RepID=UPI00084D2E16|nr:restriction endonuclease subunit S [Campylobacter pinnipediorum]